MKKFVKKKIRKAAFDYLISEKDKKSKIKGITYKKFKLQKFLTSNLFTNYEVQLLSKLRSRNVDVKSNFKNNFRNLQCSIKNCFEIEDQQHLLRCKPVLKKLDKEQIVKLSKIKYNYIFSNTKHQKKVIESIIPILNIRHSLLKEQEKQKNDDKS